MSTKAQKLSFADLFVFQTWAEKKAVLIKGTVISLCVYLGLVAFSTRYEVGMTPSSLSEEFCVSDFHMVWLIDKKSDLPKRGELWAMTGINVPPMILPSWQIVKYVAGIPGDEILITINEVYVNGVPFGTQPVDREVVEAVGADRLERTIVLGDGEYFILGDTDVSFDSRFWGVLNESQLIGKTKGII